eukprot:7389693-Prymnesium_polylepis.3
MAAAASAHLSSSCDLRGMQLRALRAVGGMHHHHLHAGVDSPVLRRPRPINANQSALSGSTGSKAANAGRACRC